MVKYKESAVCTPWWHIDEWREIFNIGTRWSLMFSFTLRSFYVGEIKAGAPFMRLGGLQSRFGEWGQYINLLSVSALEVRFLD
jgi:hypothetical protein